MISRSTIVVLGLSQLISWGITFYLIGVFGDLIMADLGWSRMLVHGGLSAALLVMGLTSSVVGRSIDQLGGARVMAAGSVLCAIGCILLSYASSVWSYYIAWLCIGLAMRATLYDAAFATLARIGGPQAKRPIAQITLLGGLAATVFWPVGFQLAEWVGWRGALLVYAGFALLTVPMYLSLPSKRWHSESATAQPAIAPEASLPAASKLKAAWLYGLIITIISGLNSGMSAHMISVLTDMGIVAGVAAIIGSLRGIGQSIARLIEVVFGGRLHPVHLNLLAVFLLPLCFMIGLGSSYSIAAAVVFAFAYGAGNGIATITRGTIPLVLFDHTEYGAYVGKLLMPGFIMSAAAPIAFAFVIDQFGASSALVFAFVLSAIALAAAYRLKILVDK